MVTGFANENESESSNDNLRKYAAFRMVDVLKK
jgi:hypothetical protein